MNCPRCGETVEPGAAFCGNCGQALHSKVAPVPPGGLPRYAVADPSQSKGEVKAMVALIIAVLAVPGAIIPALGVVLAVAGLVLATTSRTLLPKKTMSNVAIGFSCLAVVLSVGMYAYRLQELEAANNGVNEKTATSQAATAKGVSDTPCYTMSLPQLPKVENASGSCNLQAGNADTMTASSEIFTVDTARQEDATEADFMGVAKEVVDTAFKNSLPDYTITSQRPGTFAGSPAYLADAEDKTGATVQMAMVFRPVAHGENIFVLVHGLDSGLASVAVAEKNWEWK